MKKNYVFLILVIVLLAGVSIYIFNTMNDERKLKEFDDLKEKVKVIDNNLKNELLKMDNKNNEESIDDKMDKIKDLADKTKKKNENTLSFDSLKYGTVTNDKYTGEACKNACW